jgi:hypothetical protein
MFEGYRPGALEGWAEMFAGEWIIEVTEESKIPFLYHKLKIGYCPRYINATEQVIHNEHYLEHIWRLKYFI